MQKTTTRRRVSRKRKDNEEPMEEESEERVDKHQKVEEEGNHASITWGSKQPKSVDLDILRYALTTGGELAGKINEMKQQKDEESKQNSTMEVTRLRAALFKEIKEGEASLSCDKRGSRVVENLIKDGTSEQIVSLFSRLKPYVGHLVYDPFASHVVQSYMDRASEETSTDEEHNLAVEFCYEISKVDEWWPMMHDTYASHVARSCVKVLEKYDPNEGLASLYNSLLEYPKTDFRTACKDVRACPFLAAAIIAQKDVTKRELLISRLFFDDDDTFNRKYFEKISEDKTSSRLCDQVFPYLSEEYIQNIVFEKGLADPFLLRFSRHQFANYVVQSVIKKLSGYPDGIKRVLSTLKSKEMYDYDRVGILISIAKLLSSTEITMTQFQIDFCQDLIDMDIFKCLTQNLVQHSQTIVIGKKEGDEEHGNEEESNSSKKKKSASSYVETKIHLSLAETINEIFLHFPQETTKNFFKSLLSLEISRLLLLACDPVGEKKILQVIFESEGKEKISLAERFVGSFEKLTTNKIGVFTATVVFRLLGKKERIEVMKHEIIPNQKKISGSAYGQQFLTNCMASLFVSNQSQWAKRIDKVKEEKKQNSISEEWAKDLNL